MAPPPKISVLLPTYNYARYLPQAIASVLAQDFPDFELIISDDNSADDSADIARAFAARDPRIRFHRHEPNLGMVANWNWCLRQARGTYVKYVFGDDLLASPRALGRFNALLDDHPVASLAASARVMLDGQSAVTGVWDDLRAGWHDGPGLIAHCLRTRRNLIGEPSTVMFRRDAAERGFDPQFRQLVDLEMWFHLLLGRALVYTAEPLCGFRRHPAQQTAVNQTARVSDFETIELLDRYLRPPAVGRHLRPGSLAHRLVLFRHRHYIRKAVAAHPASAGALARIGEQLPLPTLVACWTCHRLMRPVENLNRKVTGWLFHLRRSGARRRADWENFLPALPRIADRVEVPRVRPRTGSAATRWIEELARGFEGRHPRRVATAMLSIGVLCTAGVLAGWTDRPPFPPPGRPGPGPDEPGAFGPPFAHHPDGAGDFFPGGRPPPGHGRPERPPPDEGHPRDFILI